MIGRLLPAVEKNSGAIVDGLNRSRKKSAIGKVMSQNEMKVPSTEPIKILNFCSHLFCQLHWSIGSCLSNRF